MAIKFPQALASLARREKAPLGGDARKRKDIAHLKKSGLFDRDYYLQTYPDVAAAGVDPVRHYVVNGFKEGRSPNEFFDTSYYLSSNPDVAAAKVNPLRHYQDDGWKEFRHPSSDFDGRHYFLTYLAPAGILTNPLAHFLTEGRFSGLRAQSVNRLSGGDLTHMASKAEAVISSGDPGSVQPEMLKIIATACRASGLGHLTEAALQKLVLTEPAVAENHAAMAQFQVAAKRWWLAEEYAARAVELDGERVEWLRLLGNAQDHMLHFDGAEKSYRKAITLSPHISDLHYRLGYVFERTGRTEEANSCYSIAIGLSRDENVRRFGVGVLHQRRGLWEEAKNAFADRVVEQPLNPELHYRLGMASDRLYEWEAARENYIAAISLSSRTRRPQWHFRLGYIYEKLELFVDAAEAYGAAIALSTKKIGYWYYRLGYVLAAAGEDQRACAAFEAMSPDQFPVGLPAFSPVSDERSRWMSSSYLGQFEAHSANVQAASPDVMSAERHFANGTRLERASDFEGAIEAYRNALYRCEAFRPSWYFRLGQALAGAGQYHEACKAFRQTRILQRPHGVSEKGYDLNINADTVYNEYSECLELNSKVILYESFNGNSLTCNPLAILRQLLEEPGYSNFMHICVLNDKSRIPLELRARENVVFVQKGSDGYLRHLATAKYLINNSGFPPYFVRRDGQKYLATWHGTPLKTLGKEQKYKFYDHKRTQRNFLQASHLITPNPHTTAITLDSYDIRQLATAKLAETGYPRIDLTLNADNARKGGLRRRLGLNGVQPIVLYAPTWRGTLDDVQFDTSRLQSDLEALGATGAQLLFRGHSLMENVIEGDSLDCTVVPGDIDTNELLSIVDVLITDYSSIFFDFFPTGRPILYYIYDQEEYEQERGLYFSMDEMAGYKCQNINELVNGLKLALRSGLENKSAHEASIKRYNLHDDGNASKRVIEFFFRDDDSRTIDYREPGRTSVIMTAGSFTPNGITTSFINLMNNIDHGKVDVALAFSPNSIEHSDLRRAQFGRLPSSIYAVPRYGRATLSLEERWLKRQHDNNQPLHQVGIDILRRAYTREFRRILGHRNFDASICFGGYDPFWAAVQVLNDVPMRKVIYLHNNMLGEYKARFPELLNMFGIYRFADKLISVSDQTSQLNEENLAEPYGLLRSAFDFCENLSDPVGIKEAARECLENGDEIFFSGEGPVFVSLARLSVEKDQEKMIRAFGKVIEDTPTALLLILGSGPLEGRLREVIDELNLKQNVHLLGYRSNPYPYLKRAGCFVLSSNHEGQPMTLLEALVLDKPIVATDIPGNRSVLAQQPEFLFRNSIEGLVEGMRSHIEGKLPSGHFDGAAYQRKAIEMFYEKALHFS